MSPKKPENFEALEIERKKSKPEPETPFETKKTGSVFSIQNTV